MALARIDGFITYELYSKSFGFQVYDPGKYGTSAVAVRPHTLELEVPDEFDPRTAQLEALKHAKDKIRAEFTARVTELDEQINNLLALEAA